MSFDVVENDFEIGYLVDQGEQPVGGVVKNPNLRKYFADTIGGP